MLTSTRTHARGRLSLRGDGVILAVLTPPVLIAASTMEAGQWVEGLPSLKAIASLGLILGFLLGRRDLTRWPSLLVATVTGAAVAGGLGFVAIQESPEVALIGMGLMALSWWIGYGTGWLSHPAVPCAGGCPSRTCDSPYFSGPTARRPELDADTLSRGIWAGGGLRVCMGAAIKRQKTPLARAVRR